MTLAASTTTLAISDVASANKLYNKQQIMMAQSGVGLSVNVDLLGIANQIRSDIKSAQNRSGFVKNLANTVYYAARFAAKRHNLGKRYHVMVFNLNQNYQERFKGVVFYGSAVYDGIHYGIWVFESGEFINQGDGGWINWAFIGRFDKNGGYVKFKQS